MTALDIPEQLVLRGTLDGDVPSILAQFPKCVELKGDLDVSFDEINKRYQVCTFYAASPKRRSLRDLQSVSTGCP